MQIDLNCYSLEQIFKRLNFEEHKEKSIDFIQFSRQWTANANLKGVKNYKIIINSLIIFIGRETLNISEITVPFLYKYMSFLYMQREEKGEKLKAEGK